MWKQKMCWLNGSKINPCECKYMYIKILRKQCCIPGLWFLRNFSLIKIFYKSPFASKFSTQKYPPRKERSTCSLYCVQFSSFLFVGMWRVCKSSEIKHPWGSGSFCPLDQRETQPTTHLHVPGFVAFVKSHPWYSHCAWIVEGTCC